MSKKIYLIFIFVLNLAISNAQVNIITTAPSASLSNGTTGLRAPNGTSGHTSLRACYFVPASEISATLQGTIASFGFVLTNTLCNAPANGTLTVYLQNTNASTYTLGTSWTTATVGMTQVFTGTYNIPQGSTATTVDFQFPSNFAYTGGALYLAYEYVGGQFASANAVYSAYTNASFTCGATNASPTLPAVNTLSTTTFRPLFRFGTPNSYTNEASVFILNAPGKVSQQTGTTHTISANIMNGSNMTMNNINVDLNIAGSNVYTAAVNVTSLAAGATTIVVFPSYNPTVLGISNVVVSIANDQNNANNSASITQSVTCDVIGTAPASFAPVSYSSGVGFGTGSGIIYSKFSTATSQTLISAEIAISSGLSNVGGIVYGVVCNSLGLVQATSNTLAITSNELNTFYTFNFSPVTFNAGSLYYVGLAQSSASPGYYPLGATPAPNATTLYVTQALTGGALSALTSNLGYFGIEPRFASPCNGVGIKELNNEAFVDMVLQPNPASERVVVRIKNSEKNLKLEIRNMLGQVVFEKKDVEENSELNITSLNKGIYFVSIGSGKTKLTKKLIVE